MPTEAEIYVALTEIFRDIFLRDDLFLTPELSAADVAEWDSLKLIDIVIGVEERYGIKLHTTEIDNLRNVGDLAHLILVKAK